MSIRHLVLVAALALGFAGTAIAQDFPVTIQHAYGETTIDAKPQRIVTWGWSNEDVVIALGEVPVGMPFQSYGGGDNGIHEWVEEALAKMGAEIPTILEASAEPPIEQIASLQPDIIIAAYSGITEDQYALLSGIAPTIAYIGAPWSTSWQDLTITIGEALGRKTEAEALLADTNAWVEAEFAKYPELKDVTFASANDFDGAMAVYAPLDARMKFLTDFGMVMDPSVAALSPGMTPSTIPSATNFLTSSKPISSSPTTKSSRRSTPGSPPRRPRPIPHRQGRSCGAGRHRKCRCGVSTQHSFAPLGTAPLPRSAGHRRSRRHQVRKPKCCVVFLFLPWPPRP
ncbi:ABC transporter substrate-binding protein [Devosia aurantiaca]|uniref:ABC transporter substrate-binding protein n=1 Tax=Devosia aurantiaca TaxID=2714858 RepID=A0A6M1T2S4_9HYPH|nr:ABC transporter substrate-binding protein [Devosia aurantiaca]NGP19091.1 ABC transporter substrate-binding protein [Devosia aurantiaca]